MSTTTSPAVLPTANEEADTLGFFSNFFAIVGVSCFIYFTNVMVALQQFKEKEISFLGISLPGKAFNSEVAIHTLSFMWIPLLLLHVVAHLYQRHSRAAEGSPPHFPYTLAKLPVIPKRYPWMRTLLFLFLLGWPTFVFLFTTGRTFQHYGLIDWNRFPPTLSTADVGATNATIDAAKGEKSQNAVSGLRLLTQHPTTANGAPRQWISSGWVWVNLRRNDELRPRVGDAPDTTRLVATQGIPILQPWAFVLVSFGLTLSTIWLLVLGFRSQPVTCHSIAEPGTEQDAGSTGTTSLPVTVS